MKKKSLIINTYLRLDRDALVEIRTRSHPTEARQHLSRLYAIIDRLQHDEWCDEELEAMAPEFIARRNRVIDKRFEDDTWSFWS